MRLLRAPIVLLVAALPAQGASEWARPVPIEPERITPVADSGAGSGAQGRTAALDVRLGTAPDAAVEQIPFRTPVREFEVGRLPDGSLIVLAGGVSEGLDIYRFDPKTLTHGRYDTEGGRRLPSGFGGDLGSWPMAGSAGLLLFAFERDDAVEFRAVVGRGILASRTMPLECEGFRPRLDEVSRQVEVTFVDAAGETIDQLEFAHPISPRLAMEGAAGGRIDFGAVPVGQVETRRVVLRNEGLYPLRARIALEGVFQLDPAAPDVRLAPGGEGAWVVRFAPVEAGESVGRLRVDSAAPNARAALELRGLAPSAPSADPAVDEAAQRSGAPEAVPAAATEARMVPVPGLARADLVEVVVRWIDVGRVRIEIGLAPEDVGVARLALRLGSDDDRVSILPSYSPGHMETVVEARALELIEIAVDDPPRRGDWTIVDRVPAALRWEGRWVAVHAPASSDFLLLEVVVGRDGATRRVLRSWRGRADDRGDARFDVAEFVGEGVEPVLLQLMINSFRAGTWRSRVLEIGPSSPGAGGERSK